MVRVDDDGAIDLQDLREKAAEHAARLAAIMVTYPSTAGVFPARHPTSSGWVLLLARGCPVTELTYMDTV